MFGAIKITKDINTSHYQYHGYGICFDGNSSYTFGKNEDAKNVIIFGVDVSFSSYAINGKNSIYIFCNDNSITRGISTTGHTTIYGESKYKTDFTKKIKNLYYHCITMVMIVIYLLMVFNN